MGQSAQLPHGRSWRIVWLMRFSVLASGSRGNSSCLEACGKVVLIDCGLSVRRVLHSLVQVGLNPQAVSGILVTHEHRDHIAGVAALSRLLKVPVYATAPAAECLSDLYALERFKANEDFSVGPFRVTPFSVCHDAVDPVGFSIHAEGLKFSQVTDLGVVTDLVRNRLRCSNAVVVESNHDPELLSCCSYPWLVKKRIASDHGHISNQVAATLLGEVLHSDLNHIVLAHLSENSNCQQLAERVSYDYLRDLGYNGSLSCARQNQPTTLFEVGFSAVSSEAAVANW